MSNNITRYSSRKQRLDHAFLIKKLQNAQSYKRIAGYFRSSIFELVGEEVENIPEVRIVCNSDLDLSDIAVSKAARESNLKQQWNKSSVEIDSLLNLERYKKLYGLLSNGNVQIRVVPRDKVFLHGKAGVIETQDGKVCFLGSINETKSAFAQNYEILWEDSSPEGVKWVEEEFEDLWREAYPLPDAIIEEIKRVADRVEISFSEVSTIELPGATLAETPIYRGGEQLQPWQRSFVTMFMEHREIYGQARLLLADEVGLGKTLSLATGAMMSALLNDGSVLILCPSTLTLQWQVELKDRLGVPSAVWISSRKVWVDSNGHIIKTRGTEDVVKCPYRIAIISTGLIFHESKERELLLEQRYGTVVLDEAHKARRSKDLLNKKWTPNNLLDFMLKIGMRTKNLLLGTATPIQTEIYELWDLLKILNSGAEFVLGRTNVSYWSNWEKALPYIKGDTSPSDEREAWELLRNPLPPGREDLIVDSLRQQLGINEICFFCDHPFSSLDHFQQDDVRQTLNTEFFKNNNPLVRHTILRRRETLEELGLLNKVGVNIHPNPNTGDNLYPGQNFVGLGLMTNHPFNLAYKSAESFTEELRERVKSAGFLKSLLLQRICSSFASGKATAKRLLDKEHFNDVEDEKQIDQTLDNLTVEEKRYLKQIVEELSRTEARDPKFAAIKYFLTEHIVEGKTWLEHGCIIFSQYYDTVHWIASELAKTLNNEVIAVYAGVGKSGLFVGNNFNSVERDDIKAAVKRKEIRLVIATDAACEGLNLQTLGTLINIDLPWNPSRLEQRLGRIKRFGQSRRTVDMLNLVYHDTQDEVVYKALSRRLKDKFDIFGGLPDTIEDEWIDDIKNLEEMIDKNIHLRQQAKNVFELRYESSIDPDKNRWELCSRVISQRDVIKRLSEPW